MSGVYVVPNGDLFLSPADQILVHGCNARGVMGAGVAKQFKLRFPESYLAYRELCLGLPSSGPKCASTLLTFRDVSAVGMRAGEVFLTREKGRSLASLCSQYHTGPGASVSAIAEGLVRMFDYFDRGKSYAMPTIGCGIGGLAWSNVGQVVHGIAKAFDASVFVYEGPGR